jgi:2-oxo-4-hydroxy-4-carboxy-5-ureidoimidazoline decarboxylase
MDQTPLKIKASAADKDTFLNAYGGIYEHSAWIALAAWAMRSGNNLDSVGGLHHKMMQAIRGASEANKMTLICAHPDLAGKLAVGETLTVESTSEQAGAGLDRCSAAEFEEFQSLNTAYKTKFGFPYIIAVKGHDRTSILANFRARLHNDRETEQKTALAQIDKIALFRLQQLTE